jgi:hypothetical protein
VICVSTSARILVGVDAAVLISYRLGSYVPIFRLNPRRDDGNGFEEFAIVEPGGKGALVNTAVFPFVDASGGELSGACAQIITDELIHEIGRVEGFRVSAASSLAPLVESGQRWVREKVYEPALAGREPRYRRYHAELLYGQELSCWERHLQRTDRDRLAA